MTQQHFDEGTHKYSLMTEDVRVTVQPDPIPQNSSPGENVYAFAYNIIIENFNEEIVQLLERYWIVMSGGIQIAEVVGPGVIGVQPILRPDDSFKYTSGTIIQDPVGSMQGFYTFRSESENYFRVVIPKFDLIYPWVVH